MDELIEALQIMRRHTESHRNPTHCEHDELYVYVDDVRKFSLEEKMRLDELGFFLSEEDISLDCSDEDDDEQEEGDRVEWYDWDLSVISDDDIHEHRFLSYRFGSC